MTLIESIKEFLLLNEPIDGYTTAAQVSSKILMYIKNIIGCEEHSNFGSVKCSYPEASSSVVQVSFDEKTINSIPETLFNFSSERFSHVIEFRFETIDRSYKIYKYITDNNRQVVNICVYSEENDDKK